MACCSTWAIFNRLSTANFSQATFSYQNWLFVSNFSKFGSFSFFCKNRLLASQVNLFNAINFFLQKSCRMWKVHFCCCLWRRRFCSVLFFLNSILSAVKISFQAKSSSKNIVARHNPAEHRVQADVLPRSVSRHFSARKTFSVSLVGSCGNTQLTQTVGWLLASTKPTDIDAY